jgi:hypothetical protein
MNDPVSAKYQVEIGTSSDIHVGDRNIYVADRAPVAWPHVVGVVPPPADCRQERAADHDLDAAIHRPARPVECQVLVGLGGVGKTQLAAGFARRALNGRHVDLVVWVTATSRADIVSRYAQAAADVTGVEDRSAEDGAARFVAWLERFDHRWLVVIDDLTDPNDLVGLWPPTTTNGWTLVTSRRRDAALLAGRHPVDVDLFTTYEAAKYLSQKLGSESDRLDEAEALAKDLGYLPLALSQAAAYIVDQRISCAGYRQRLSGRVLRRLAPAALPDDYRTKLAATFALSINVADTLDPIGLASPVIELAALLDPNDAPINVFATAAVTAYCADRIEQPVDADDTLDALRLLQRFSLAVVDETASTIRVHSLVQRAVREATQTAHQQGLAEAAAYGLRTLWPDIERDHSYSQLLRANTAALHAAAGPLLWTGGVAYGILYKAGNSLAEVGSIAEAVEHYAWLHSEAARRLGADHRHTLTARANLAHYRGAAGDVGGAVTALEGLLDDQLRLVGADHLDTLDTRHDLARWRGEAGDVIGAVTALEALLADRLRLLGPDHAYTLDTRKSLASWRGRAGDVASAVAELEKLATHQSQILGADHTSVFATRLSLAWWWGEAGRIADALETYESLIAEQIQRLGPDHPDVLVTRQLIARRSGDAGDPAGAVAAFEALLTDQLRILGPHHPDSLDTRHNLARWRGEAGDPAAAVADLESVLEDKRRILGDDNPNTLATRHELARWHWQSGNLASEQAFQDLLEDRVRILGPDHPDTLITRLNLADLQGATGDPAGAALALGTLLGDYARVLGPDHPVTMKTRYKAAAWLRHAGDAEGAIRALEALLADQIRVLGPIHPDVQATRKAHASWADKVAGGGAGT